ncbi:MAG: HAD family hydrolase [Saprospiraceae bacterium]|nr:HAD family hydrolase [Lewinella sp.]
MNKYTSIIWDWNGTLLDDTHLCVDIANVLLTEHHELQLDRDHYREVFGFPITEYYRRIGIDLEKESFESLTKKFFRHYDTSVLQCSLHRQAGDVLQTFRERGLIQFILTAAHKNSVLQLLEHFTIREYFAEIEGLDNHRAESKVARGIQLMQDQGIERKEAVLIGDTLHDYEVAQEIGVDCILIANGHQSRRRLETETRHQILILDEVWQLPQII